MHLYPNPVCAKKGMAASIYCCTEGCQLPAFGCSDQCVKEHPHGSQRNTQFWEDIEGSVHQELEGHLPPAIEQALQKQGKDVANLAGELKLVHEQHIECVKAAWGQLQLRGPASKVLGSMKARATQAVTGHDMAQFVALVRGQDLYANKEAVEAEVAERTRLMDGLFQRLRGLVEQHRLQTQEVPPFVRLSSGLSLQTKNSGKVLATDRVATVGAEPNAKWYPVALEKPIERRQSFCVEVVEAAESHFLVGVGSARLKDLTDQYNSRDSLCISAGGYLFGGTAQKVGFQILTGDTVEVRVDGETVRWSRNGTELCSKSVPPELAGKPIYPFCWIQSSPNPKAISRLRFA